MGPATTMFAPTSHFLPAFRALNRPCGQQLGSFVGWKCALKELESGPARMRAAAGVGACVHPVKAVTRNTDASFLKSDPRYKLFTPEVRPPHSPSHPGRPSAPSLIRIDRASRNKPK